jgi:hypothetical protein
VLNYQALSTEPAATVATSEEPQLIIAADDAVAVVLDFAD